MNPLQILQYAMQYGPSIQAVLNQLNSGASNASITDRLLAVSGPLADILDKAGAEFFPQASPTIHLLAGALAAFAPNTTKQLQTMLNTELGLNLTVDGVYGAATTDAVKQLQTKLGGGLVADGVYGAKTRDALAASKKAA